MTKAGDQIAAAGKSQTGVGFAKDIAPLFNATEINCMKQATGGQLDLSSYPSVKSFASQIYTKVAAGDMPPPPAPAWTPDMVNTFGNWIQQGMNP